MKFSVYCGIISNEYIYYLGVLSPNGMYTVYVVCKGPGVMESSRFRGCGPVWGSPGETERTYRILSSGEEQEKKDLITKILGSTAEEP